MSHDVHPPADSRPESYLLARDLRKGFGNGLVLDGVSLTAGGEVQWTTERCSGA